MSTRATRVHLTAVDFDPFAGPAVVYTAPTIEPQIELWTSCQLGGDDASRAYNESISLRLTGRLDRSAFERAFASLIDRHEALRTGFSTDGTQLCVFATVSVPLTQLDWSAEGEAGQQTLLADYVCQDARHRFDLINGPLLKAGLLTLSETEYYFILTAHHLICDGWSVGILLQDMGQLYSAYVSGRYPNLPEAIPYSRYTLDEGQFTQSDEYHATEQFWLAQYRGPVPVLNLPTDFPRPALRTYASRRQDYPLDRALTAAVKQVGAKAGSSFVTTLLAAFEVLLHRLTGQTDLVLGLPTAGQSATGYYRLVGHCVNLLPLRSSPRPDMPFGEFLNQRRHAVLDAFEHQRLTFGSLLRRLAIPRDPSRVPLVPVIFNVDMGLDDDVNFQDLRHQLISNPRQYETVELFANISGSGAALTVEWSYNTQLFRPETIDRMMAGYDRILRAIVANPMVRLADIALSNPAEQGQTLAARNDTAAEYPRQTPLHQLLAQTANRYPDKPALVTGHREASASGRKTQTLSYQDLHEAANRVAHGLRARGIGPGTVVGVLLDRTPELLITLLAVLKAGAAYLPLDPDYPADRVAFMLTDSSAGLLITSRTTRVDGLSATEQTPTVQIETMLAELAYPAEAPAVPVSGTDLAYILYTSGSTGRPKGVLVEHRNLVNLLTGMLAWPGITSDDILLGVTTVSFDIAGLELFLPLLVGATLVLADAETTRDGRALLDVLTGPVQLGSGSGEQPITLIQATPATYKMLLAAGWEQPLPQLKILCCGEPLSKDLARKLTVRCGSLWNMYGPTETTIYSTGKQILTDDEIITIGRPIHNTQVYILDRDRRPVPDGQEGEIYVAGDGVARGYWNRPDLTAEKFVPNPFDPPGAGQMYRTGDLGYFTSTGEIVCLGRIDQQVKIRGYRIELGEIENTLLAFDDISEAVVIAREDRADDPRLVAYVVPASGSVADPLADWQQRWDVIYDMGVRYEGEANQPAADLDTAIALQLGNGNDLREQADEWLNQSIERLRALNASRIMEVGSGAGQLLFALAPNAQQYIATDYAQTAIDNLKSKLAQQADGWRHVTARTATADDFSDVGEQSLDLVLIHSVAQYFPNMQYFLRVLEGAVAATADGGCVFVGDMQSRATLTMHHAFDQLRRSADGQPVGEFRKTVDRRVQFDDELMADPAFFYGLSRLIPRIAGVDTQLREGSHLNETTKHHYDVWLYVGKTPAVVTSDNVIDWRSGGTIETIEQGLAQFPDQVYQITNVSNGRLALDHALLRLLGETPDHQSVGVLKNRLDLLRLAAVDPNVFWSLGAAHDFRTHVRWSGDGTDGQFEVVFIPNSHPDTMPNRPAGLNQLNSRLETYVKNPYQPAVTVSADHVRHWKQRAAEVLPAYMVPADFVVLPKLPLTPNGKIDRKALPKPESSTVGPEDTFVQPRTDAEKQLAVIWQPILGLDKVGIDDNFFELGGHSMIAVQVMTRLERETGKRLPLSTLLTHPTIRKLAPLLETDKPTTTRKSLVPIKPQGGKMPIYIIHGIGLNLLNFSSLVAYMDPEQPIYGFQARGLDGQDEPLDSMEAIAAHYITELLEQNPDGPYAIAGYSFGGYVALEMARQLKADGKDVKLLAMFDTNAIQAAEHYPLMERVGRKVVRQFAKTAWISRSLVEDPAATLHYQGQYVKRQVNNLLTLTGVSENPPPNGETDHLSRIMEMHETAYRNYVLPRYDGVIDLFKAEKRVYFVDDTKYLGWNEYALRGVRLHEVPGDHEQMLLPPNDKIFAQTLQRALDAC